MPRIKTGVRDRNWKITKANILGKYSCLTEVELFCLIWLVADDIKGKCHNKTQRVKCLQKKCIDDFVWFWSLKVPLNKTYQNFYNQRAVIHENFQKTSLFLKG